MLIISFVTQKGGSGKTTLAINCAVVAQQQNKRHKVLLLDMDAQGTAENWYQVRSDDAPQVVKIKSSELDKALKFAVEQKFDVVLIDTPGRDEPGATAAIRASDFCVIPCRPSPADITATPVTIETVKRLEKPAAFVLTQTPVRSFRIRDAENALKVFGLVCPVQIVARTVYQDAQGSGMGVSEFEPKGKATEEVKALWTWIVKTQKKGNLWQNALR